MRLGSRCSLGATVLAVIAANWGGVADSKVHEGFASRGCASADSHVGWKGLMLVRVSCVTEERLKLGAGLWRRTHSAYVRGCGSDRKAELTHLMGEGHWRNLLEALQRSLEQGRRSWGESQLR